jgi:hypothetical protein
MKWKTGFICLSIILTTGCAPKITNIVPYSGNVGDTVRIHGDGLTKGSGSPTAVDFNGTAATTFSADGTTVLATVPPGATSGPIHVTRASSGLLYPGRTATSPADFTVITSTTSDSSIFPNADDTRAEANVVASGSNAIQGSLSGTDTTDFFKIATDAGPYGYTIEFHAMASLPSGTSLRVVVTDNDGSTMCTINVDNSTSDPQICWTAQPPGPDNAYLEVSYTGAAPSSAFTYDINIARIPINDPRETLDNTNTPSGSTSVTPGTAYHDNYLGVANTPSSDVDDYYSFNLDHSTTVVVTVMDAGLPAGDFVNLYLTNTSGIVQAFDTGSAGSASLSVALAPGEWRVLVTNSPGSLNNYGNGSAPGCFKQPYRLAITLND